MKIIKLGQNLTVITSDGTLLTNNECTDALYQQVRDNQDNEDAVKHLLIPELYAKAEEIEVKTKMLSDFNESEYLSVFGNSIYIKSISELTVPEDLATAIYKAEQEEDYDLIQSYLNFWTLASLNPDSRARTNLFWFLQRYGMTISSSGLFVAYRNVELKSEGSDISHREADFISSEYARVKFKLKKSPKNYYIGYDGYGKLDCTTVESLIIQNLGKLDELYLKLSDEEVAPIYTDAHTKSFTIKIGEVVSMDRSQCDPVQENTCSNGLHVAGREWLSRGYFGQHSLVALVNPADVVAVPHDDNYGKMRTCAYYPVQLVQRDEEGDIIDLEIEDGFEDDFISKICYQGEVNNVDDGNYHIDIPETPEISRERIMDRLLEISEQLKSKTEDFGEGSY